MPALTEGEILARAAGDGASPGERIKRRGGDIYVGESVSYASTGPMQWSVSL